MAFLLMVYTMDLGLSYSNVGRQGVLAPISSSISIVLVILYILYLFFRYKTHAQLYEDDHWVEDYQPDIPDLPGLDVRNADGQRRNLSSHMDDDRGPGHLIASFLAIFSCVLMVFFAISIVTHVVRIGASTTRFYGLFVVPVCLKAALHFEAIRDAFHARMESTLATTMNGALRAIYLLFPLFILVSRILRYPMNLLFDLDDIMVTALATFILAPIMARGSSTFLDGGLLLIM